jgi:protein TonB
VRFFVLLLISAGVHGGILLFSLLWAYAPAMPLLRRGEISVELTSSAPSAPSPRVDASPPQATENTPPPEPAPLAIPKQPDHALVLPAPTPLTTVWQPNFAAWTRDLAAEAPLRIADADLRRPSPPSLTRERNAPTPSKRADREAPPRDMVQANVHQPPQRAAVKPSATKPETVAKSEGQPSPGSPASAPSTNQPRGVTKAHLIGNTDPPYPLLAQRLGIRGTVVLSVIITEQGAVVEPKLYESSGHRILDDAALDYVRTLRFEPARRGSERLRSEHLLKIHYNLY